MTKNDHRVKTRRTLANVGHALYWVGFALVVVLGVKVPWLKYVAWVLAGFYALLMVVRIFVNRNK